MNNPFQSIKPLLLCFKIVSFPQFEVFASLRAFLRGCLYICFYEPNEVFCFWCLSSRFQKVRAAYRPREQNLLLPYSSAGIYGGYKENLRQESFCTSALFRSLNLLLFSSFLLLRPSISLRLKTSVEVSSVTTAASSSFLCFQPLSRPSTAFLYTFHAYFHSL